MMKAKITSYITSVQYVLNNCVENKIIFSYEFSFVFQTKLCLRLNVKTKFEPASSSWSTVYTVGDSAFVLSNRISTHIRLLKYMYFTVIIFKKLQKLSAVPLLTCSWIENLYNGEKPARISNLSAPLLV